MAHIMEISGICSAYPERIDNEIADTHDCFKNLIAARVKLLRSIAVIHTISSPSACPGFLSRKSFTCGFASILGGIEASSGFKRSAGGFILTIPRSLRNADP